MVFVKIFAAAFVCYIVGFGIGRYVAKKQSLVK